MSVNFEFPISRLESISSLPTAPPEEITPAGLSYASSITPAAPLFSPLFKPELDRPNVMFAIIQSHQRTEVLTAKQSAIFKKNINSSMEMMDLLTKEKEKILEEELKAIKSRNTWSSLGIAAEWLSFAATLTLGFSIGGIPGIALLVCGGVALGTRALLDTGLLDVALTQFGVPAEIRNTIFKGMEIGLSAASIGLGIFTGYTAYINPAVLSSTTLSQITSSLQVAGAVTSAGVGVGQAFSDWRLGHLKKDLDGIKNQLKLHEISQSDQSKSMLEMLRSVERERAAIQEMVYATAAAQA